MTRATAVVVDDWVEFKQTAAELVTEVFTGLDLATASGRACVACGRRLHPEHTHRPQDDPDGGEPVGLAEGGGRVFACVRGGCAELARAVLTALALLLLDGDAVRIAPDRYRTGCRTNGRSR